MLNLLILLRLVFTLSVNFVCLSVVFVIFVFVAGGWNAIMLVILFFMLVCIVNFLWFLVLSFFRQVSGLVF